MAVEFFLYRERIYQKSVLSIYSSSVLSTASMYSLEGFCVIKETMEAEESFSNMIRRVKVQG
ncbi:hypothetical protein ABID99_003528 [Mucilaginibacter sp. OAE612]